MLNNIYKFKYYFNSNMHNNNHHFEEHCQLGFTDDNAAHNFDDY